jgi:hypothetical protein
MTTIAINVLWFLIGPAARLVDWITGYLRDIPSDFPVSRWSSRIRVYGISPVYPIDIAVELRLAEKAELAVRYAGDRKSQFTYLQAEEHATIPLRVPSN